MRIGRRSTSAGAAASDVLVASDCPRRRPPAPAAAAAGVTTSCERRSPRQVPVSAVLALLLSSVTRDWPRLIVACGTNAAVQDLPMLSPSTFNE